MGILGLPGNHASRWIRDLWSKGVSLILAYLRFGGIFPFFKIIGVLGILGPPYCGIGSTIRISQEMLCLLYAGFFLILFLFCLFLSDSDCSGTSATTPHTSRDLVFGLQDFLCPGSLLACSVMALFPTPGSKPLAADLQIGSSPTHMFYSITNNKLACSAIC